MKKGGFENKRTITLILAVIIIFLILSFLFFPKLIGLVIQEHKKQVQFHFIDELTNCPLNGYVFVGEQIIGKTDNGLFNLTYSNYQANFQKNKEISIFGKLRDCFNSDLFFDEYWGSFEIEDYYFEGESLFTFKTQIIPNNPSKRDFIGFIQPSKVKSKLNNINLKNKNTLQSLSEINNYLNNNINYADDWDFNKETNYWQAPEETLKTEQGDCEDYSTALLSLFLAYNNSLNCYNIIFTSHVTTFCYIDNYYIYYDQEKTELKKRVSNKTVRTLSELTELKEDYFEHYGINESERAYYAFNDNLYIEFKSEEEFLDWQYNLNEKSQFDLFNNLEKEAISVQERYPPVAEEAELRTQITLITKKSFPYVIVFLLMILFVILLIILIKINKKNKK